MKKIILTMLMISIGISTYATASPTARGKTEVAAPELINLNLKDVSIAKVLQLIERQTGKKFIYRSDQVIFQKRISINANNQELAQVLDLLKTKGGLEFKMSSNGILVKRNADASVSQLDKIEIKGKIVDKNGAPLPGANVIVESSGTGTVSDFNGEFKLEVPEDAVIIITYIGYQSQTIQVNGRTSFNIVLEEDSSTLNEVVVVGYGETSKESLIDAVAPIDAEQITERPISNAVSGLQGLSPGLNITQSSGAPSSNPTINIRGFTSINGGEPLIIIDGVEGDLNSLNPNDIESISVLKDAGASAIYGARGAFGVVLVTTKKAKEGNVAINFNSTTAISTPTINTDFVTDPYQAVQLVDQSFQLATGNSYTGYNDRDYQALQEVSLDPSRARTITDIRNGREQYVYYGNTNWWDRFFRKTYPSQIYNGSISGGSDKVKGYFSYRHYKSTGILKVQDDVYKKYNLRGKVDIKFNEWLTFSNNMQYNNSNNYEHGGSQYGWDPAFSGNIYVHALPFYMPTNPDGTATWRTELNNYTIGDGAFASLLQGKAIQETINSQYSNIATANIKPFAGMDVTASYAIRRNNYNQTQRSTRIPYSIYTNEINTFGTDQITEYNTTSNYDAFNIYGEYKHFFGDHFLKATLGFNQEKYLTKSIEASKQNSISNDLNSLGLATSNPQATGSASEWAIQGLFYRLAYDYKGKYLVEFNGRYDGSSRFPSDYRWGFFPSVSAGWLINKEAFFDGLSNTVNLFKVRASYGSLGNQNIADYAYIPTMSNSIDNGYALNGNTLGYITAPALNPTEITWEEVKTLDLGTDITLLDNSINITFDWFQRDTDGMLTQGATLPSVLGTSSPQENAADLRTRGFELSLGYNHEFNVASSPLNFSIVGNLSNSVTKITSFNNPNNSLLDYYEGMTIGELWGYHVDGLFQSEAEIEGHADQTRVSNRIVAAGGLQPGDVRYVDLDGNGVIDEGENTLANSGDKRVIGNTAPQYLYSFRLSANWKGFDISAFFQGVGKQDWYPSTDSRIFWGMYARPYVSFIRKDLAENIWSEDNRDALYPRLFGYTALGDSESLGAVNDRYLQSVAYLRLKNLTVGYTLPKRIIDKLPINKFRIYFSGDNLLTFTKLTDYIDPEAASNSVNLNAPSTSSNRGTAQTVPFSEVYSLGVSVQF
ncbi:SusC/RagA family TonB-linked outer membrane protein [Fulvivirga maritima]|uniref:SusC/RagA family TonB-linked outer membrane protein n=1 Tax=Fulvivirga maritima TaxID=2904247 RepID=UPI001F377E35|nr:SusC/RagA family TonB-linked outer membrane protein [Fulvivirga maritima]UII25946.1 SusC/RagA family TonB-linked outer membrane protein [Fulvivirga maritima]